MKTLRLKMLMYVLASFLLLSSSIVYAVSSIEKEYVFQADTATNLKYDYKKQIEKAGKIYKVDEKSVKYEVLKDNKVSITKKGSISSFKDEIEEYGIKYKLDKDSIKNRRKTTKTEVYKIKSESKKEVKYNNETLKLSSVKEKKVSEPVNLPARFYGYPNSKIYKINGKDIEIKDRPVWNGYERDVAEYLKLKGEYKIYAGRFTTGFVKDGNVYRRDAIYPAVRTNTVYEATYENEVEATYEGIDTSKKVEAKVSLRYDFYKNKLALIVKIIAGIVAAIAIATILFILLKRRKKKGYEDDRR